MSTAMDGNFEYGETVATPVGMISFPSVWEPRENQFKAGKMEFSCGLLIPKSGVDLSGLIAEAMKPVTRMFGNRYAKLSQFGDHCPIKDGDDKGDEHPSFGHWVIKATAGKTRRPFVVDKDNRPVGDQDEIYGGAIGLLWVKPMAYDMKVGKGVKFILEGVQKIADGKPFGQPKFDPAATGYKAPEVPDYLRGHMQERRSFTPAAPVAVAPARTSADQALINELKGGFGAVQVTGDEIPF